MSETEKLVVSDHEKKGHKQNPEEVNMSAFESIKKKNSENPAREYSNVLGMMSIVSNIGFTMIACVIVGLFAGVAFEKYVIHKTSAVYVVIGSLLGVAAGFISVYKNILKKFIK